MCVGRRSLDKIMDCPESFQFKTIKHDDKDHNLLLLDEVLPKSDFKQDLLAITTQQTKHFFQWINSINDKFHSSAFYK